MPAVRFVLQGFRAETQLDALTWVLACPRAEAAILSVAFVRRSGVRLLADALGAVAGCTSVFAGIRNGVTSTQGVESLLALGVRVHLVDTASAARLFHPKVYFARGPEESRVVVGSPNMTAGGLSNNIEASLCLTLDPGSPEDDAIAAAVESGFAALPESHPNHVFRPSLEDLPGLGEQGRLVDEDVHRLEPAARNPAVNPGEALPPIPLETRLRVDRLRLREEGTRSLPTDGLELMWRSKPLVERDLNIPSADGTNPTGSINLDKGLLDAVTDHRHYFRETVFAALTWNQAGPTVEVADAQFRLVVKNVHRGDFDAVIAHTTSTTTAAYLQRNAMTRLRWGSMAPYVVRRELLGRTLQLFRESGDGTRFVIVID